MKRVDYIVVGLGIAGISFCEQLRKNNKSYIVFNDNSQHSSSVAGGVYNPVILKRFTAAWMASEQLQLASQFYNELQTFLNVTLNFPKPVYRILNSIEEQNNWAVASDNPELENFLETEIITNTYPDIIAPFGFGKINGSGMVDTNIMIDVYKEHLFYENKLSATTFRYDNLNIESDTIVYGNIHAKYIVFAEGFGLKNNPFFKDLPLTGTKGEVLIIDAPDLNIGFILKSSIFIIPLGNSLFYIGATYEHTDKSYTASEDAKLELLKKLKNVIRCKFTIVEQKAGIRPTTRDRRPLVGRHDQLKNLCVLNGLGTRGIMIAPYISNALYNHLENDEDLNPDIDISRFK